MKGIHYILSATVMAAMIYLGIAYLTLEPNPLSWDRQDRGALVIGWTFTVIFIWVVWIQRESGK